MFTAELILHGVLGPQEEQIKKGNNDQREETDIAVDDDRVE